MKTVGLLLLFEGPQVRAFPLSDGGLGAVELAEVLPEFCKLVLADPDLVCCLAGLHTHVAGSCAKR